jgi:hypothetical protein
MPSVRWIGDEEGVGVSYYTDVRIDYGSEDGSVTDDVLLAEVRVYLSRFSQYANGRAMQDRTRAANHVSD